MRLRGNERSAKANHGPLGSGIDGAHHASSMYEIAASTRRAARMPSPVLVGAPRVHCALLGRRWYSPRMSSLLSNPPHARMTPHRACMVVCTPPDSSRTPTTRSLSVTKSTSLVPSSTVTPASRTPSISSAMSAGPSPISFFFRALAARDLIPTRSIRTGPRQCRIPVLSQR